MLVCRPHLGQGIGQRPNQYRACECIVSFFVEWSKMEDTLTRRGNACEFEGRF